MKLLPRLVIVLVICLIGMALPPVPAQAQCVPYDIELSPSSGVPGTEVTVYGYDFDADWLVDIYYDGNLVATERTTNRGDFTITFTVPEGCTGHYQVLADVGYATVDAYFTVKPGLTASPEKGPVATTVTVEGQGFAKNEDGIELMYYLNGDYETIERRIKADARGSWETSFQIPPSTRGEHKLDAEGYESKLYEVEDATFRVTEEISIDKSSGSVGESITMTGSRFAANERDIKILFDGQTVIPGIKANAQGAWEASFEVPEMSTGEYSVTAEGEQTQKEDIIELSFEIKPDIVLSPDEGHVGMNLTVTGRGFAANEDVVIKYEDEEQATATTNDKGSFEASLSVPESPHGKRQVTAGYVADNAASAIFTMESDPPPIPELVSLPDGGRVGLIGRVTPTFEWSEVSDDSGVRYNLQIATSTNVNATGEFADPLVSKNVSVGTSYTLKETEALPYGTYYWIVQAVDGAENESGWTAAHSFRAGLLPLWALIAIIVAIVVLLVALIRFLVIRRSIYYDRW
ncbi:MAG: IPT/TIG domain-containing protein [Dehalococcoidia bacterium]